MVTREQVIAEARSWIGTPFMHQQTIKGVGVDCGGIPRGVCIALGTFPADYHLLPEAQPFLGYQKLPDGVSMQKACETFMTPISRDEMQAGDAILVKFDSSAQHLGILTPYRHGVGNLALIHATPRGVVETRLMFGTSPRSMKFVAAYRLPGVD